MSTKMRGPGAGAHAGLIAALLLGALSAWANDALDRTMSFDIGAQPMPAALVKFSEQSGIQVAFPTENAKKIVAPAVVGELTPAAALDRLLAGSGLRYELMNDGRIVTIRRVNEQDTKSTADLAQAEGVRLVQVEPSAAQNPQASAAARAEENPTPAPRRAEAADDAEVVVTGSHIKGVRPSSPVVTITQEEMRLAGQNNLGELIRSLPQNFSGGQNPGVQIGAGAGNALNQNITGGSTLNLRGLGPDATLTLLNGARLPYDGYIQATDVATIPRAAIERIEILLDGASAIYGSDAVGGVANIVLKRDYDGAELSARYGAATQGGFEEQQYTAVVGNNWGGGGLLLTADYSHTSPILVRQRDYLSYIPSANTMVYPGSTQKGALLSAHQALGDSVEFALDAFYTRRNQDVFRLGTATIYTLDKANDTIWGAAPSLTVKLAGDWTLGLQGFAGRNENFGSSVRYVVATGAVNSGFINCYCNETQAAEVDVEGPLFALPGGNARISVGGGYRKNEFTNELNGAVSTRGSDQSYHVYGEMNLPLVSPAQNLPMMRQLSLTGAVRHENYDSFGRTTTPKIGMLWGVTPSFDVKATWGRSFKVPTLVQMFQDQRLFLYPDTIIPGAQPNTTLLVTFGGNRQLDPERARIVTAGFVVHPESVPGLRAELSWFDIDYTDRVVQPLTPVTSALTNPAFADFVSIRPSVTEQNAAFAWANLPVGIFTGNSANFTPGAYNPANVYALLYASFANAASQRTRGVDLFATYTTAAWTGNLTLSGSASWITDSTQTLTSLAPSLPVAGNVFTPAKFRGRLGLNWAREGFTVSSFMNRIDGVKDIFVTPNVDRAAMTTVDLIFDYQAQGGAFGRYGVTLATNNLFDKAPPYMFPANIYTVNYDSTNYSAIGRTISLTLTKPF